MIPGRPFAEDDLAAAGRLIDRLRAGGLRLVTAESCTGGLIGGLLTALPGASDVVDCGFVTYSNEAKSRMLGVPAAMLAAHGAVSDPVARAMADGARSAAGVAVAVSATGIAGPGGGTADKPVGLVYVGLAVGDRPAMAHRLTLIGDRGAIRLETVRRAVDLVSAALA